MGVSSAAAPAAARGAAGREEAAGSAGGSRAGAGSGGRSPAAASRSLPLGDGASLRAARLAAAESVSVCLYRGDLSPLNL